MKNYIFLPFSFLYRGATLFYHFLYDKGIKKSYYSPIFCVSIGNLTVGGTGKTPFTAFLIELFKEYNTAVLSRGYGRNTKGFIEANLSSTSQEIGDEPKMLFQKFDGKVPVFVCEDRLEGLKKIRAMYPSIQIVFLDDAHQHRKLNASFYILLSDYNRPFYSDTMLPTGRLRESKEGIIRADSLVVTKTPSFISENEIEEISSLVSNYNPSIPIFFSSIKYEKVINNKHEVLKENSKVIIVSGIANSRNFEEIIKEKFEVLAVKTYGDHHVFTKEEVEKIKSDFPKAAIVCTEKDFTKIQELFTENEMNMIFYLPISFEVKDNLHLKKLIEKKFISFQRSES